MIDKIIEYEVEKIVLLSRDSLMYFELKLIELLGDKFGTKIEIIDNTNEDGIVQRIRELVTELERENILNRLR